MLLIPLFHHCNSDRYSNSEEFFDLFFAYVKDRFRILMPGEKIEGKSLMITFDDGYYDFYRYVFPLLKKHGVPVLLAVSPKYILQECSLSADERLRFTHDECYDNYKKGTFCTWDELAEMVQSGLVRIASHGYSHIPIDESADLELELKKSRETIENRLKTVVDSLVYPFGRYSSKTDAKVSKVYPYRLRIGNAVNFGWNRGLLYRINADDLSDYAEIFSPFRISGCTLKYIGNVLRGK